MTDADENRLTINDCARAGYCPSGIRRWCHSRGIDLRDFIDNGLDIEFAKSLDDGLVNRALEMKEKARGG